MKVVDIADQIYQALAEPSDISLVSVVYWLRSNIGALNNYINQDFYVDDSTLEINRVDDSDASLIIEMAPIEAAILKRCILFIITTSKFFLLWGPHQQTP